MNIIKNRKIFTSISFLMMLLSIISIMVFGFKYSVDFAGGSVLEFTVNNAKDNSNSSIEKYKKIVTDKGVKSFALQKKGDNTYVVTASKISDEQKNNIVNSIKENNTDITIDRFQNIGPSVSSEIASKSITAIVFVILLIIGFITYVFSGVSEPVSSFKYGIVAVVALAHDVLIPAGLFAFLGSFMAGFQIDVLFVTAILAILGFSVNDTIVVFDRVRENLRKKLMEKKSTVNDLKGDNFKKIVGQSLNETLKRSFLTSLTTVVVLGCLYFIGGETTKEFSLVLIIGMIAGTYSSIFFASPLLVMIEEKQDYDKIQKEKEKKQKEIEEEYPYSVDLNNLS